MRQRPALDEKLRALDADLAAVSLLLEDPHLHVAGAERTGALQMLQQRRDARGPRDNQGSLPAFQPQRSEEPRKAVEVVAMQVRDQLRIQEGERKACVTRRA